MMTTIYLVSKGSYSDYHVCGVYSTREKADHAQKLFGDEAGIEVYDLDDVPDAPPGLFRYSVTMSKSGDRARVCLVCVSGDVDPASVEFIPKFHSWSEPCEAHAADFRVWARDDEHAVKIANEKRTQMIAEGRWPTEGWEGWLESERREKK